MIINDKELFEQVKKDNKQSFERLFRSYYAPLCLFAKRYISDSDDCEEIVQNFFFNLWERRASININTSIKNYLFSSIRNRCLNHIKHSKIKLEYQTETIRSMENNASGNFDYPEIDLMEKISSSIEALPKRRREIFKMSREEGLKYQEIADHLEISVKTVEVHMGLALKSLRESLRVYKQFFVSFFMILGKVKNKGNDTINCQTSTKYQ